MRGLTDSASLKIITHKDRNSGGHNWPKTFWGGVLPSLLPYLKNLCLFKILLYN